VGEINGEFGTAQWTPILYLRHAVDRQELVALYTIADVAWVTPLRDGMNLVAKEFCACKPEGDGVLVLSQFAGAAAEMGEAILVNPYDEQQVVSAILKAFAMPVEERTERMQLLRERVIHHDVFSWAERFIQTLQSAGSQAAPAAEELDPKAVTAAFQQAEKRVLILDYDGTLVPLADNPATTSPSRRVTAALTTLAANPRNVVSVLSGRRTADLDRWLGGIPSLVLGAEHGALMRCVGDSEGWRPLNASSSGLAWKSRVRMIVQQFADRAPGSFLEEKEYSIVWHYRRVEPEFGNWLAGELTALLDGLLADTDARPLMGRKIVEVCPVWANKGGFARHLISMHESAGFVLAAGDDTTDESMFEKLDPGAVTVHVGAGHSRARYRVKNPESMINLLTRLAQL